MIGDIYPETEIVVDHGTDTCAGCGDSLDIGTEVVRTEGARCHVDCVDLVNDGRSIQELPDLHQPLLENVEVTR